MPRPPRKTEFLCPACGFAQLEPAELISTYCRGCGDHYTVVDEAEADALEAEALPAPATPLSLRPVICFHCGSSHRVPVDALNTQCPGCHACIDFDDFLITSNVSTPIDTRGHLEVAKGGYLNASRIICGSARIEGRMSGALECFGELSLAGDGRLTGAVGAGTVIVEKTARIALVQELHAYRLVVHGTLEAAVFCAGSVRITRGGTVRGDIHAHSLIVEQGGVFMGNSVIRHFRSEPAVEDPGDEVSPAGALFARLAPA